jgi:hypothetical protein
MPESPVQSGSPRETVEFTYVPSPPRPLRTKLRWAIRTWARSTFSRDSFLASLRSLLWVAPLTLLIWIYAEREQVVPLKGVPVALDTRSNEVGRVVRLLSPAGGTVSLELEGPQAELEQVKDWLESTSVPIEVDRNLGPGEHQFPIAAQLNRLPKISSSGVTVVSSIPAEVRVFVDPIKQWDLEVKARPEDKKTLSGPQVFTPAKVRISGPQSVIEAAMQTAAAQGQSLVAYANFAPFKQQLAEPGKHSLSSVAVSPSVRIDDASVTVSPATVSADIEVTDKAEKTITLPYVRVLAAYPPDVQKADQLKPVYESTIPNVIVSGPDQQIALLQEQKFVPAAIFEVRYDEVESPTPAPVMFQLPPGVHVSEQDAQRKITYTFKPRGAEPQ